jgi:excinuclease ABC subunit C
MTLQESIKLLPNKAGVYQYFDASKRLLYIGKAKDLKKRVSSYFRKNANHNSRIATMIEQTHSLEYIIVDSEHDALILENSLIKQLKPKYNILLRDDKTYPYIYIDTSKEFPRFEITRKVINSSNVKYFGPYSVGARDILDSIYEICKLVQKKGSLKSKKRCLYYQIDKCLAPCELKVDADVYKKEIDLAVELIQNKKLLIKKLQDKMYFYSQNLRFEEAGELRDRCERISRSEIKSEIDFATDENYDIFALSHLEKRAVVVRIFMRNGKIISSSHSYIVLNEGYDEDELYQRVLLDFYVKERPPIVAPILVASKFMYIDSIKSYLSGVFEKKASIIVPQRGKKKELINLALLNAKELLKRDAKTQENVFLDDIKELFALDRVPKRVEIFDNSHMAGMATVGAMVVYDGGEFDKKSYRTYHLKAKDEYSQMRETLSRRVESFSKNSPPDLWVIDGGATLLKLACEILDSSGVFLDVIAISKEKVDAKTHRAKGRANDIIYTKDDVFKLKNSDKRLQWVQNLRDEAHRCAINFHKKTKLNLDKESKLLSLHGISEAKVKKLLNHFTTFEALKKLSIEEISDVLSLKDAKTIKNIYF